MHSTKNTTFTYFSIALSKVSLEVVKDVLHIAEN